MPMPDRSSIVAWLLVPAVALAVIVIGLRPSDPTPNPEARAYALAVTLKCPICVGESIASSQASLAKDLRAVIAEEIAAGRTDEEIRAMFVASYGEGVLLDPPRAGWGLVLWAVPFVVAAVGGIAIYGLRRREPTATAVDG